MLGVLCGAGDLKWDLPNVKQVPYFLNYVSGPKYFLLGYTWQCLGPFLSLGSLLVGLWQQYGVPGFDPVSVSANVKGRERPCLSLFFPLMSEYPWVSPF